MMYDNGTGERKAWLIFVSSLFFIFYLSNDQLNFSSNEEAQPLPYVYKQDWFASKQNDF